MSDYILIVVLASVVSLLLPAGAESGTGKSFRFLSGLIVLLTVAAPVLQGIGNIREIPRRIFALLLPDASEMEEIENTGEKWVIEYSTQNIEEGVSTLVENRYGLALGSVRTHAFTKKDDLGQISVVHLTLYVDESMAAYTAEIAHYISDVLMCPCDVVIE